MTDTSPKFSRAHGASPSPPSATAEHGERIGERLKKIRKMYGLSQRELAKRAGVTNGTISLIEQDRISPSVGSLKRVLDGFPMSLADFFTIDIEPNTQVFYRADELVELAGGGVSLRQIGRDLRGRALQVMHEHYQPGADTGEAMLSHPSEEAGVVLRGQLEVTVGGQSRVLGPGEAFYFNSRLPHRFRNPGDELCELVTASTPPSF